MSGIRNIYRIHSFTCQNFLVFVVFGVLAFQYVEVRNVCLLAYNRTEISEDDSDYYSYKHYL